MLVFCVLSWSTLCVLDAFEKADQWCGGGEQSISQHETHSGGISWTGNKIIIILRHILLIFWYAVLPKCMLMCVQGEFLHLGQVQWHEAAERTDPQAGWTLGLWHEGKVHSLHFLFPVQENDVICDQLTSGQRPPPSTTPVAYRTH